MNKIYKLMVLVALTGIATFSKANEDSDKLVEILDYKQQFKNAFEICKETINYISPEDLLIDNPDYFYGFNEDSEEWPQVVSIYKQYYESSCDYINTTKYMNIMSEVYESSLSKEQLQQILKFYSTPTGKKLVEAGVTTSLQIQLTMHKDLNKSTLIASEIFRRELLSLAKKAGK